ncbi:hypothetical protein [Actinopolymorpha pittospori]|uniref:Regulatory protein n=1 Tax=Actinopolymorpha pittospori TaxID=648752 RepID=A0A927MUB9_9ACTN|nr:hypothetical protein [Actinopolymorpha pittospori]MBE1606344.1 hypothetical protein [Actinopolymorpha pittospori]
MNLHLDGSRWTFTVTKAPEPKTDNEGRQKTDRRTGERLTVTQMMALNAEDGADVITVTVAGDVPKVSVGQIVTPVELEAIPWATNGRNGVAYRAKSLDTPKQGVKAA